MAIRTFTFGPGGRSPDAVAGDVRAVARTLADDPDHDPAVGRYGDRGVTWTPVDVRPPGEDPPGEVVAPVAVRAVYDDDGHVATATVYRRVAGEFLAVDEFTGPIFGFAETRDYVLCNYDVEPEVGYRPIDPIGGDRRFGWLADLPADGAPDALADPDPATDDLVALLAEDRWYHVAAARLRERGYDPGDPLGRTDATDPAVRRVAAARPTDDRFRRLAAALPATGPETQRLVAPVLWRPPLADRPDPALVRALATARDCEAPAARAGALTGLARVVGAAFQSVEADGPANGADDPPGATRSAVRTLVEALAAGLDDDHRYVRFRAAGLAAGELTTDPRDRVFLRDDAVWWTAPFEARWRLARRAAALTDTRGYEGDGCLLVDPSDDRNWYLEVYDGDPSTLPSLVEYGWDDRPQATAVRSVVADVAAEDPGAVADYVDRPLASIRTGEPTTADVRIVAALAGTVPDEVATVVPELVALLDGEDRDDTGGSRGDDRRRAAARALSALREVRPEAVPLERETVVEATADVLEDGDPVPDRVATLAAVDPDTAVETVDRLCRSAGGRNGEADAPGGDAGDGGGDRGGDGPRASTLVTALYEASAVDPAVAAGTVDRLLSLVDVAAATDTLLDPAGLVLARAAVADPGALREHVDDLAAWVGTDATLCRAAVATAIAVVGDRHPGAVPDPLDALVDRGAAPDLDGLETAHERTDVAPDCPEPWPLGVLAAADPAFAADAVLEGIDLDARGRRRRTELLAELYAAGDAVGDEVLGRLIDRAPTTLLGNGAADDLFERSPGRAAALADVLVGLLADDAIACWRDRDRDRPTRTARAVERALRRGAERDPAAVRAAIERQYESVDAFVAATGTGRREAIAELVRA